MTSTPLLIMPRRAATILDVSLRKVYQLVKEGELKGHNRTPGRRGLRILFSSVQEYVRKYQEPEMYE